MFVSFSIGSTTVLTVHTTLVVNIPMTEPNWLVYPQSQYRAPDLNVLRSLIPTTDTVAIGTVADDDDDFPKCTTDM